MLRTRCEPATDEAVKEAAGMLRAGKLVAFPTETVYGLGADATSDKAVAALYAAKERPSFNPLIAHVRSLEAARREGAFSQQALDLAAAFWPGPLTLVVPVASESCVCALARAGLDSIALRVPAHGVAQALLAAADLPIVAPSANRSGRLSPTSAMHVKGELDGRIDMIIDGGPTSVGLESTIVSCLAPRPAILRPGGLPRAAIERVLGQNLDCLEEHGSGVVRAPGMLASHYAPRASLRLNAEGIEAGEAALDFAGALRREAGSAKAYRDLSPTGDLIEAAANLYAYLHVLDASGAPSIAVATIPASGLGEAVNDRLRRAAAPRTAP